MYLHLGQDIIVNTSDVIAVLDMDNTTISKITKEFLRESEKEKLIVNISEDLPKSYVLCEKMGKMVVYISPISSSTLLKRAEQSRI